MRRSDEEAKADLLIISFYTFYTFLYFLSF